MANLLFKQNEILEKGGLMTAIEIEQQPELWQSVYDMILSDSEKISKFLNPFLSAEGSRIILTGAGSSAFIGEAAQGIVQVNTGNLTQAIATTDLITHPHHYFKKDVATLLISFARSGNSPESLAAVELANQHCDQIYHLIITCNKDGALVQNKPENAYHLVLPEKANDKGLAMTGSFTAMLLSVVLVSGLKHIIDMEASLALLISETKNLFRYKLREIKALAERPFKRLIFLGSGPLLGIARECHLKVQELTDGQVICKHDSFLGFRHGPRAVVNEDSLIVYLFSTDPHVARYERDLFLEIDSDPHPVPTVSWNSPKPPLKNSVLDIPSQLNENPADLSFIGAAVLGQLIGFYKCLDLGLMPDNPSVSGSINRVVQGVTIYSNGQEATSKTNF